MPEQTEVPRHEYEVRFNLTVWSPGVAVHALEADLNSLLHEPEMDRKIKSCVDRASLLTPRRRGQKIKPPNHEVGEVKIAVK
jgi:hypothetical protein